MINRFVLLFFLLMTNLNSAVQDVGSLRTDILKILGSAQGRFAVAFRDLQTGRELLINEREMFHAASTMKTPVMIEVFKKSRAGLLRLEDSIVVRNEFRSIVDGSAYSMDLKEDSDESMYKRIGGRATVRELVVQMITVSSNLATNILIDLVGASDVTTTMRTLGADSIQVLRGVEDLKAYELGLNNRTTAHDLLVTYRLLAEDRVIDTNACRKMLDILAQQRFRDVIPAFLPEGIRVANKTGSITGIEHDSGIVFLPDGRRYVLVLLSGELKDAKEGKRVLAGISKRIYDFVAMDGGNVHRTR